MIDFKMIFNERRGPVPPALQILLLLSLLSCGSGRALETKTLLVGDTRLTVELADTPESRQTGLMHREALPENRGMLFVFEQEQKLSFWMKNTSIPLSIAYISKSGVIREIHDLEPFSESSVSSSRSMLYALEVNRGWFARHGIEPGDRVRFDVPGS